MGGAWQKLILLCIKAQQAERTKSAAIYGGKPPYVDPEIVEPEPDPGEGGDTDAGY